MVEQSAVNFLGLFVVAIALLFPRLIFRNFADDLNRTWRTTFVVAEVV